MVGPRRRCCASSPQHPFTNRYDEANFLGHGNEDIRGHHATNGVTPANEGLKTADLISLNVDDGLIIQLELAVSECLPQVELETASRLHARVHLRFKEAEGPSTIGFRA